jgi:acyl-CoA synthetase (AMP-forming)/AMP-acid ligase II
MAPPVQQQLQQLAQQLAELPPATLAASFAAIVASWLLLRLVGVVGGGRRRGGGGGGGVGGIGAADDGDCDTARSSAIQSVGDGGLAGNGTVVDVLRHRAAQSPRRVVYTFVDDKGAEVRSITLGELLARATDVAAMLQQGDAKVAKGDRVVLCYPPGLDFAVGFWGCMLAGAAAIPMYPPYPGTLAKDLAHFNKLVADAGATVVLTNREYDTASKLGTFSSFFARTPTAGWPKGVRWFCSDGAPAAPAAGRPGALAHVATAPADIAFFQYSSGSTSAPKAVMISHGNLRCQLRTWDSIAPGDVMVSWLPSYHDMGLVGFIVVPAFTGARCVSMSPISFIKDAAVWMRTASKYRATHCCAPNFGFALAARKTSDQARDALDLSCLKQAICAAEPIRAAALDAFVAKFGPVGFRRDAFNCGYGLAEVTLTCTGHDPLRPQAPTVLRLDKAALEEVGARQAVDVGEGFGGEVAELVGCGYAAPAQEVAVVDTAGATAGAAVRLPEDRVGEVWTRSEAVSVGYWGREELSKETFGNVLAGSGGGGGGGDGGWLATGDQGFLRGGQLFITGRLKDLIIVHGRNVMPQDLEADAEAAADAALRPGCSAAFSVERGGEEHVVLVAEARDARMAPAPAAAAARAVRAALLAQHQLGVEVIVIAPRSIPKTTSGKIQRSKCKAVYLEGGLKRMRVDEGGASSAAEEAAANAAAKETATRRNKALAATRGAASTVVEAGATVTEAAVEAWLKQKLIEHRRAIAEEEEEEEGGEEGAGAAAGEGGGELDMDCSWAELGLDSVSAVNLSARECS